MKLCIESADLSLKPLSIVVLGNQASSLKHQAGLFVKLFGVWYFLVSACPGLFLAVVCSIEIISHSKFC